MRSDLAVAQGSELGTTLEIAWESGDRDHRFHVTPAIGPCRDFDVRSACPLIIPFIRAQIPGGRHHITSFHRPSVLSREVRIGFHAPIRIDHDPMRGAVHRRRPRDEKGVRA